MVISMLPALLLLFLRTTLEASLSNLQLVTSSPSPISFPFIVYIQLCSSRQYSPEHLKRKVPYCISQYFTVLSCLCRQHLISRIFWHYFTNTCISLLSIHLYNIPLFTATNNLRPHPQIFVEQYVCSSFQVLRTSAALVHSFQTITTN